MLQIIIISITGLLGAVITYYINCHLGYEPVRASAISSLVVGLFFYFFPEVVPVYYANTIPFVFIGGSFIGMVSYKVMKSVWLVAFSGVVFSFFYLNSGSFFQGYGGALGTAACISVVVVLGFNRVYRIIRLKFKKIDLTG